MTAKRKARNYKAKDKVTNKRYQPGTNYFQCNHRQLLILTGLTSLGYFLYSFTFDGFYQHDEVAHFLGMMDFWNNPNGILDNWSKPGFKVLYAVPALGGKHVVTFLNCLISGFCCYFVYRIAERQGLKYPLVVFFCLALQPMWIQIGFRHYAEIPMTLLYVLTLYFFKDKRYILSALCLSYAFFHPTRDIPDYLSSGILSALEEGMASLSGIRSFSSYS